MIVGVGIDIQTIARVERAIARGGKHFLDRTFTPAETRYCQRCKKSGDHFAARFCAKEAFMKALGTGWSLGVKWTDISVARRTSGQPFLKLSGLAQRLADKAGVKQTWLSLSHSGDYAVATVILER